MALFQWYFALILIVCLGMGETTQEPELNDHDYPYDSIRLPGDIIPLKYKLFIHPNVTHSFDYTGEVKILLQVKKQTSDIIFHSLNISHYLTQVYEVNSLSNDDWDNVNYNAKIPVKTTLKSLKLEQVMVRLEEILSVAKRYVLVIYFGAPLRNGLRGFYRSSHQTPKGVRKYIATTHFEPTGARLAFPCFDEPAMKATFQITLVRQHGFKALSNMPSYESKIVDSTSGLIAEYFQESVKMSTYLVAFIVGEFSSLSSQTKRGVKVNVYVPDYQIAQAQYAREVAPKILDYYENFFQLQFPLPKLDLIGIPDFCLIAMENWGLVTYRLTGLLYDPQESSASAKSSVAEVIAHELAHQWFGNLVTMKWWNDLWLNEGFAAFVEYIGTDIVDHRWKKLDEFPVNNVQHSMSIDSHLRTHAVKVDVKNPADIGVLFDHSITYQKGSSVIRMMRDFMGAEAFGKGLKNYLKKYQFSNAESDDLWNCLSQVTTYSVKEIMDTWIFNKGYPVITVRRKGDEALLTQGRFLTDVGGANTTSQVNWKVPLTWRSQYDEKKKSKVFNGTIMRMEYPRGWWKLNADEFGFYRVNYDENNWKSLANQLKVDPLKLTSSDRANLIDDVFALAMAGRVSEPLAFDLMEYFTKERDWAPVEAASNSLAFIDFILYARPGPGYRLFQKYILKQFMPLINVLGFDDVGSYHTKLMRTTVLKIGVQHNHPATVQTAQQMFHQWMTNGKKIPTNLREVVYYAGIKYGGAEEWNFMFKEWKKSKVPTEKVLLMYSLAATTDEARLLKYLQMTLDEKIIKSQDACYLINKIAINPVGRMISYNFLSSHWSTFIKVYGSGDHFRDLTQLFTGIFSTGKTKSDLDGAQRFFKSHESEITVAGGKLAADQAVADIKLNIDWLNRNEKVVVDWLKKKDGY